MGTGRVMERGKGQGREAAVVTVMAGCVVREGTWAHMLLTVLAYTLLAYSCYSTVGEVSLFNLVLQKLRNQGLDRKLKCKALSLYVSHCSPACPLSGSDR